MSIELPLRASRANPRKPSDQVETDEVVFVVPLLVPYLFTTGPLTDPTTALVFKTPQRVPPIRAAAAIGAERVGSGSSRSSAPWSQASW